MMITCAILVSTCFWHSRLANIKAKIKQFADLHHGWPEALGLAVSVLIRLKYGSVDDADIRAWLHEKTSHKAIGLV